MSPGATIKHKELLTWVLFPNTHNHNNLLTLFFVPPWDTQNQGFVNIVFCTPGDTNNHKELLTLCLCPLGTQANTRICYCNIVYCFLCPRGTQKASGFVSIVFVSPGDKTKKKLGFVSIVLGPLWLQKKQTTK